MNSNAQYSTVQLRFPPSDVLLAVLASTVNGRFCPLNCCEDAFALDSLHADLCLYSDWTIMPSTPYLPPGLFVFPLLPPIVLSMLSLHSFVVSLFLSLLFSLSSSPSSKLCFLSLFLSLLFCLSPSPSSKLCFSSPYFFLGYCIGKSICRFLFSILPPIFFSVSLSILIFFSFCLYLFVFLFLLLRSFPL